MTIHLVSEDDVFGGTLITGRHFGVNLVTIFDEEFVDPTHELAQNVQELQATTLRFPGGSATENYFDMTQPDLAVSARDASQTLTPMDQFFARAGEIGTAVTIVVPTQMAFGISAAEAMLAGTYGNRQAISADYQQQVADFVQTALDYAQANGVRIDAFEIGNEFWGSGEMTAAEYGRVAGAVASLLEAQLDGHGSDAEILVQTTSSASQIYSSRNPVTVFVGEMDGDLQVLLQEDIDQHFSGVLPEGWQTVTLSGSGSARAQVAQIADGINAIAGAADAVDGIVQHYYQSGGFEKADGTKSFKFSQFQNLADQLHRATDSPELSFHITEWNTNASGAANNRGLQNASMMIENFFEMVSNGVDVAQIWPLSFDAAQGISLVDLDSDALSISGEMFRLMSESLQGSTPLFDWAVEGTIDVHGFAKPDGAVLFVSERSGVAQAGVGLDLSQVLTTEKFFMTATQLWDGGAGGDDSTAPAILTDSDGVTTDDLVIGFDLDSWSNLRVEITAVTAGNDVVHGRGGADVIQTFEGADIIHAGAGADRIEAGAGDDVVFGEDGDDVVLGGGGADLIDGGAGHDTAVFAGAMFAYQLVIEEAAAPDASVKLVDAHGDLTELRDVELFAFDDGALAAADVKNFIAANSDQLPSASGAAYVALADVLAYSQAPTPPAAGMEVGRASVEQLTGADWHAVSFSEAISDAVVVMGPGSANGGQPFTIRVRNVTESGFEFQVDEWDYLDGYHKQIDIGWLAGSAGTHLLSDGSKVSFGMTDVVSMDSKSVHLDGFTSAPILLGQLTGEAETGAITHRISDVTHAGFDFLVQREEAQAALGPVIEASGFSYAALDIAADSFLFSSGVQGVNHKYTSTQAQLGLSQSLFADMQTRNEMDTAALRYDVTEGGQVSLKVQEERSYDREARHLEEQVAWVVLDDGVYDFV